MSAAGAGASSRVQPLSLPSSWKQRWRCQGVVAGAAGPGPVAGLRPLGCGAPLQQWPESSTAPPHPPLFPRQEKTSQ